MSAPHIYHSALILCPQQSIVQRLYGPQAKPMARVIQGVPTSWDPSVATRSFSGTIYATAWSPCSRFIAISSYYSSGMVVLDAMTLEQLYTVVPQEHTTFTHIIFSPDGHFVTGYSQLEDCIISWDIQTGGLLSDIRTPGWGDCNSVSYSECGKMVGGMFGDTTITICNIISGIRMFSHEIQQPTVKTSWTCGEYLQFATVAPECITIWQVSFTSSCLPTKSGSFSLPDHWYSTEFVLLHNIPQPALINDWEIVVWGFQNQKVILHCPNLQGFRAISFSPNGHFFIFGTNGREFQIWKESHAGYFLHQTLICSANGATPLISPDGELVISSAGDTLQLWHTESSLITHPSVSTQTHNEYGFFLVEFSPDESLVAVAKGFDRRVTILDVNSGNSLLVVEAGGGVFGLRITESQVIAAVDYSDQGKGGVVTWNLSARDCVLNTRESVQTITFNHSSYLQCLSASISPNLDYLAVRVTDLQRNMVLIYNMHTGKELAAAQSYHSIPGFTPSSHEVWCVGNDGPVDLWEIIEENGPDAIELKGLEKGIKPQGGFPWESSCGYQIADDGWIFSSGGKRLFWLPHLWQSDDPTQKRWGGKFLVIWNKNSSEPSILELDV